MANTIKKTINTSEGILTHDGFFLITFRKCINLQLWAETEDELFEGSPEEKVKRYKKAPYHVVPCYKSADCKKNYIIFNNALYRV